MYIIIFVINTGSNDSHISQYSLNLSLSNKNCAKINEQINRILSQTDERIFEKKKMSKLI